MLKVTGSSTGGVDSLRGRESFQTIPCLCRKGMWTDRLLDRFQFDDANHLAKIKIIQVAIIGSFINDASRIRCREHVGCFVEYVEKIMGIPTRQAAPCPVLIA